MRLAPSAKGWVGCVGTLLLAAISGCGGSGGDGGESTLTFAPSTDATVRSDTAIFTSGGIIVGDTSVNVGERGALRFALFPFLPANAVILSARLQLRQVFTVGSPFGLGNIVVDRADFGATLGTGDFAPVILTANLGTLSNSMTPGVRELDVTAAIAADVASQDLTSDFLLRFSVNQSNNNLDPDEVRFNDVENSPTPADAPTLIITYR
jgi:hypothetical protein